MPTVGDIATLLNVSASGDSSRPVRGIATLRDASATDVSFLSADEYIEQFFATRAAAVIIDRSVKLDNAKSSGRAESGASVMVVDDAELALATALQLFAPPIPVPPVGIDPAARVSPSAKLGQGCRVGPFVYVGDRTTIGANSVLHAGVYVADDVTIGNDCQIFANVSVRERVTIGHRVILNAGSVIGTDGFGYKWDPKLKQHVKIPHIGTVIIEDDVEIGSCACVDRAKFAATRIGRGSKLDNMVQVGHNVVIGPYCVVAGQVGIGGSAELGTGVAVGGQTAIRDHIKLGDGARIASCSAAYSDIEANAIVSGIPASSHRQALRAQFATRKLPDLLVEVRKLRKEIEALQAAAKQ